MGFHRASQPSAITAPHPGQFTQWLYTEKGSSRAHHGRMLVVDAANVVGSRPNGWWRDRGKAAADLCQEITAALDAGRLDAPVVVVLEGAARRGVPERAGDELGVAHASGSGDDAIVALVAEATAGGRSVTVVTADRALRDRAMQAGGDVVGPRWLLDQL